MSNFRLRFPYIPPLPASRPRGIVSFVYFLYFSIYFCVIFPIIQASHSFSFSQTCPRHVRCSLLVRGCLRLMHRSLLLLHQQLLWTYVRSIASLLQTSTPFHSRAFLLFARIAMKILHRFIRAHFSYSHEWPYVYNFGFNRYLFLRAHS